MTTDNERKARELLAAECPECGGEQGHRSAEGDWLNCGRCRDRERLHSVDEYQALRAISRALTVPAGVEVEGLVGAAR